MWLPFTRRTHCQISFLSHLKTSSKVRFMCTTTMWQLLMVQNTTNLFPLRQDNHHTTLRVESNQSRRRPTSWSLSKLPDSGLYAKPLPRGGTLPLASLETDGPIAEKFREKVESLSLKLSLFKYGLPFPLPLSQPVGRR